MRNVVVSMLIVLLAGAVLLPAAGPEDEVLKAEKNWANAVTAKNFKAVEAALSDELIYAHSTGVIESKAEYLGKLRSGTQVYDVIDHLKTTVKVHGNAAAAHSIVVMKGTTKAVPFDNKLMMMHLWVMEGGRWRLAAHQTTRLEQ